MIVDSNRDLRGDGVGNVNENQTWWDQYIADTSRWNSYGRIYPSGPMSCNECPASDAGNFSESCLQDFGPQGCTAVANDLSAPFWIVLYLLWIVSFLFMVFWGAYVRKTKRIRVTKIKRRTGTFNEYVASGDLDSAIAQTVDAKSVSAAASIPQTEDISEASRFKDVPFHQPPAHLSQEDQDHPPVEHKHTLAMDVADRMTITCYQSSRYESFGLFLIWSNSAILILYLIIVIVDYYVGCEVKGPDNFCFYGKFLFFGEYEHNGTAIFLLWWVSLFWFLVLITFYDSIRNWLRLPSGTKNATHVLVWVEDEVEMLSTTPTRMIRIARSMEKWFQRRVLGITRPGHSATVPVLKCSLPSSSGMRYFEFECARYTLPTNLSHSTSSRIRAVALGGSPTLGTLLKHATKDHVRGLSDKEASEVRDLVGTNEIAFKLPTWGQAARDEFFTLFYLYQFASYVVWLWFAYWFVGIFLVAIVLMSAITNIILRVRNLAKVMSLTVHHEKVSVRREGAWKTCDARDLVPGDLVLVESSSDENKAWKVPADLVLVQGSCATDESGLTGESMPVAKSSVDKRDSDVVFNFVDKKCAKHLLFAGTSVLEVAPPANGGDCVAVVMATGIDTSRGELIGAILYPTPMRFQYDEEFPIVLFFLVLYSIAAFILSIYFMERAGAEGSVVTRWTYSMYTISEIISPMLKISLSVGQINASRRLAKVAVMCVNPPRIAISGKLRVFCFDKTGTLTKEGLDFIGVRGMNRDKKLLPPTNSRFPKEIEQSLATCHAVTSFRGRLLGNAVEVSMFTAVGWSLASDGVTSISPDGSEKLKIVRRFEFDHARMTMSVVVELPNGSKDWITFAKGAPEKIAQICDPDSVPSDFLSAAHAHAMDGCYVLGLARSKSANTRSLAKGSAGDDFDRDELESDLECIGLLLFRNELKSDTKGAIEELIAGAVRPVMVTGDNAACGQYIARACGMTAQNVAILLGDISEQNPQEILWKSMAVDTESIGGGSSSTNNTSTNGIAHNHSLPSDSNGTTPKDYKTFDRTYTTEEILERMRLSPNSAELAVTGRAFDILTESDMIFKLLPFIRIFARMSPHNKIRSVKLYIEEGLVVGMCGDGGNDVGALRCAHVGLALSEAEASVVAPFTSGTKSAQSAPDLLREGRASLSTSFAGYKFLIMYGLLFSCAEMMSYRSGVVMTVAQYMTMDLIAVVTLGYAMTLAQPNPVLGMQQPTSSLLDFATISSVLGCFAISCVVLGINWGVMISSSDYVEWPSHLVDSSRWWENGDAWEVTTIFFSIFTCFVTASFAYSFGGPYRRSVFTNRRLVIYVFCYYLVGCILLMSGPNGFTRLYHMSSEGFNTLNSSSPVWVKYQQSGGAPSPGMSLSLRFGMLSLTYLFGCFPIIMLEKWLSNRIIKSDEDEALKWTGISIRHGRKMSNQEQQGIEVPYRNGHGSPTRSALTGGKVDEEVMV